MAPVDDVSSSVASLRRYRDRCACLIGPRFSDDDAEDSRLDSIFSVSVTSNCVALRAEALAECTKHV